MKLKEGALTATCHHSPVIWDRNQGPSGMKRGSCHNARLGSNSQVSGTSAGNYGWVKARTDRAGGPEVATMGKKREWASNLNDFNFVWAATSHKIPPQSQNGSLTFDCLDLQNSLPVPTHGRERHHHPHSFAFWGDPSSTLSGLFSPIPWILSTHIQLVLSTPIAPTFADPTHSHSPLISPRLDSLPTAPGQIFGLPQPPGAFAFSAVGRSCLR